jgi:NADH-quinone oxidoreductase subunit D
MHNSQIMPIGPQHPALKEAIFLKFNMKGNMVESVDLNTGYMHKGIERMLDGTTPQKALIRVERICGICSQAHSQCFTNAVEGLLPDLKIPMKARMQRMIMGELERIHSHLLWVGVLIHEIGLQTAFMLFWRERERIMDCFDALTGGRVHHAVNAVGSSKYDFSKEDLKLVKEKLKKVDEFILNHLDVVETHDVIVSRFKGTGVISKKLAEEYNLIGPNGRASGLKTDIRINYPYELYDEFKFKVIVEKEGDVYARMIVRLKEILESIKIIREAMARMPATKLKFNYFNFHIKEGMSVSRVEAPRGELLHFLAVKDNIIQRAKLRTPTFLYMNIYPVILSNIDITDVPVVLESMDPCFSCMERTLVSKNGKSMLLKKYLKREKA